MPLPALKYVPLAAPSTALARTFSSREEQMTTGTPAPVASLAPSTFVAMPPVPLAVPAPVASASISGVTRSTYGMCFASGSLRGSAVYSPSVSVSSTSRSACTIAATWAESMSLSPSFSSAIDTVSFSFIIGTAPRASSTSSAEKAL